MKAWRICLTEHKVVAAMLIDLNKAFDWLPHRLLLDKLGAYGLSNGSFNLLICNGNKVEATKCGKQLDVYTDDKLTSDDRIFHLPR